MVYFFIGFLCGAVGWDRLKAWFKKVMERNDTDYLK